MEKPIPPTPQINDLNKFILLKSLSITYAVLSVAYFSPLFFCICRNGLVAGNWNQLKAYSLTCLAAVAVCQLGFWLRLPGRTPIHDVLMWSGILCLSSKGECPKRQRARWKPYYFMR